MELKSARQFHTELALCCTSMEALFMLSGGQNEELELAAHPALCRFRALLDAGDAVCGPEDFA